MQQPPPLRLLLKRKFEQGPPPPFGVLPQQVGGELCREFFPNLLGKCPKGDGGLSHMTQSLILLGRIIGAHGIRGAVKLRSFTTDPKAIATYGALQTADGRSIEIARMKAVPDGFIADLKNIKDRNQAETFKGQDLLVPRERLPATDSSEVYLVDLIGQDAMHIGAKIGTIIGIENFGAGDLLDIDTGAKESLLVPSLFMKIIDGVVTLELPEGFLDLSNKQE